MWNELSNTPSHVQAQTEIETKGQTTIIDATGVDKWSLGKYVGLQYHV
jgi:predicted kinase